MASSDAVAAPVLSYDSYLQIDDLLNLQRPVAAPAAHDELMFILVHQVYELWFRLLLHELTAVRDAMMAGALGRCGDLFARCRAVERQVLSAFDVMDTLSPRGFGEFRDALTTASGFQSVQFREIEILSAGGDQRHHTLLRQSTGEARSRLARRLREPNLWEAFLTVLARRGLAVDRPEARRAALLTVARGDEHRLLWQLAEGLVEHDQAWSLWRARHALLAERQIGARTGTGGSTGVSYLRSREHEYFFPELWAVRGEL